MPWHYRAISPVAAAINEFLLLKKQTFGIRAYEYVKNGQYSKVKGLGRLNLSEKSILKWAYGTPAKPENPANSRFGHLELWAPHWETCSETENPPIFYWNFLNPSSSSKTEKQPLSAFVILAFAEDMFDMEETKNFVFQKILNNFKAAQAFYKLRKWAYKSGTGFHLSLQDFPHNGLFKDYTKAFTELIKVNQLQEPWAAL